MNCELRRENILKKLCLSSLPVSASKLADEFGVSRQIIVKDIAKLRENGENIVSLSRGYVLEKENIPKKVFKVIHTDDEVEKELCLIIDMGGVIEDVFIYHKYYNKVRAELNIKNRNDIFVFLENIKSGKSSLLKNVTGGYHYHTVTASSDEILKKIENELWSNGFLAKLQEYEPTEITF